MVDRGSSSAQRGPSSVIAQDALIDVEHHPIREWLRPWMFWCLAGELG
jgi:hypothetical protein